MGKLSPTLMTSFLNMPWKVSKKSFSLQVVIHSEIFSLVNELIGQILPALQNCKPSRKSAYSKNVVLVIVFVAFTFFFFFVPTGIAAILYECRLGCLEEEIPQETEDYIDALHLMFSSFKTTMYAGAIPKWLRPVFPKPWKEFCDSWDGLFRFSERLTSSRC